MQDHRASKWYGWDQNLGRQAPECVLLLTSCQNILPMPQSRGQRMRCCHDGAHTPGSLTRCVASDGHLIMPKKGTTLLLLY